MLAINKISLQLLLEQKREFIGLKKLPLVTELFGSVLAAISVWTFDATPILGVNGLQVKTILMLVCLIILGKGLYDMYKCVENNYTHKELCEDIVKLDEKPHCFSLVVIKDTFAEHPNRYLLQYVASWDCRLFPYYRTVEDDIEHIKQQLAGELGIAEQEIILSYKFDKTYNKYSVHDKCDKVYNHTIYYATIAHYPQALQAASFMRNGKQYFWMSFADMDNDERIQKHNSEVVKFVQEIVF